jgi:hypothetical protein
MRLRLLTADDLGHVDELIADPQTLRFARVPEPPPDGFSHGWYESYDDAGNAASQRVAANGGYRLEGVLRNAYFKPGRRADTEMWSRLPSDPAPNARSL